MAPTQPLSCAGCSAETADLGRDLGAIARQLGAPGRPSDTLEPGEPGTGFVFESAIVGGSVPEGVCPRDRKGFKLSVVKGVVAGYPVVDVKFTLTDGGFHALDSSQIAFEVAAKAGYRQTMPKAGPQLLEPIMKVDVFVPDANVGDTIGDLNRRRGM